MIIQMLGALIAVTAFSVILEVPKKYLFFTGLIGCVGWTLFLILTFRNLSSVQATFWAALLIAFISHIFARIFKAPVTVFLIAGILPLVPGSGMYRIVQNMLQRNSDLVSAYLIETIQIAGVIALGIFITDSVFRILPLQKLKK